MRKLLLFVLLSVMSLAAAQGGGCSDLELRRYGLPIYITAEYYRVDLLTGPTCQTEDGAVFSLQPLSGFLTADEVITFNRGIVIGDFEIEAEGTDSWIVRVWNGSYDETMILSRADSDMWQDFSLPPETTHVLLFGLVQN